MTVTGLACAKLSMPVETSYQTRSCYQCITPISLTLPIFTGDAPSLSRAELADRCRV